MREFSICSQRHLLLFDDYNFDCLVLRIMLFILQTDAKGLHWKKFTTANTESASRISEDPVLLSYSNAVQQGILCSWQRLTSVSDVKDEPEAKFLDWGKELILFWYGEEPQFSVIISPSLRGMCPLFSSNSCVHNEMFYVSD